MDICLAETDEQIAACYSVMRELRPHVREEDFVARVRVQQRAGYRLVYAAESAPVAVAGFRIAENLAWGRFLYVDDLVALPANRSRGHGAALLAWLARYAFDQGCAQLHLDSGVRREDAHRFYRREGMALSSYHFSMPVGPEREGRSNS
jgi:GNAT superfamily N-acetyltransferase